MPVRVIAWSRTSYQATYGLVEEPGWQLKEYRVSDRWTLDLVNIQQELQLLAVFGFLFQEDIPDRIDNQDLTVLRDDALPVAAGGNHICCCWRRCSAG